MFKIVHATNHEHFKGTKYLRKAVTDLKKENYKIELSILKGTSNSEVLKISQADVVFDQLSLEHMADQLLRLWPLKNLFMLPQARTCEVVPPLG